MTSNDFDLMDMARIWAQKTGRLYVLRSEILEFSCGVICGKTLANYESKAEKTDKLVDLPVKIDAGGRVAYLAEDLVQWFARRREAKKRSGWGFEKKKGGYGVVGQGMDAEGSCGVDGDSRDSS